MIKKIYTFVKPSKIIAMKLKNLGICFGGRNGKLT
jgi:hypothetical protein